MIEDLQNIGFMIGRWLWRLPLALLPLGLAAQPADALDQALRDLQSPAAPAEGAAPAASGLLRLTDLSFVADAAWGYSPARPSVLSALQAGHHDPGRSGFSLNGAELAMGGAVDPYFQLQMNVNFAEGAELEEAYARSSSLPWGLELKAGRFNTEIGILNSTHPHAWAWLDQPVILSRLFGGDAMRGEGLRLAWLAPLPWLAELSLSAQNADGENMISFLADPAGGEPATIGGYAAVSDPYARGDRRATAIRLTNSAEIADNWNARLGLNAAVGPNATGPRGKTGIYGIDLLIKWNPPGAERGFPYFVWQSEAFRRDYIVDKAVGAGALEGAWSLLKSRYPATYSSAEYFDSQTLQDLLDTTLLSPDRGDLGLLIDVLRGASDFAALSSVEQQGVIEAAIRSVHRTETLHDYGYYSQILLGFLTGWSAGLRYEFASGSGESRVDGGPWLGSKDLQGRDRDPARDTRVRISPLLVYQPSEFSRFRLQYNEERADHLRERKILIVQANEIDPTLPAVPLQFVLQERARRSWSVFVGVEFLIGAHPAHAF
ncbi:MAG: hypothetical protein K1X75_03950 [Leptospirales bacterium]|nr:hypothetical protein [Leptospirales bacterium]